MATAEPAFTTVPTPVQKTALFALCLLAALGLIALFLHWRIRTVSRRLREKLKAQLEERDRIALERHDSLLQSTQGLVLRFQAVADRMHDGDPSRQMLEAALERADDVLVEGRQDVRGMASAQRRDASLSRVLSAAGSELSAETDVTFRFEMIGPEPNLSSGTAKEVERIAFAALLNAFQHARARAITIRMSNDGAFLSVCVADDGVGIGPDSLNEGSRPGHQGLRMMRERTARIGASLKIGVPPAGGTQVDLMLPLASDWGLE